MITITIGQDSCQIPETQLHWFKTLEHAVEYLHGDSVIQLPVVIADQSIDISQFLELVKCYQAQIENDIIDYNRDRNTLEHYLDGILDDLDGQTKRIMDFIINCDNDVRGPVKPDLKLYQLASNVTKSICAFYDSTLTFRVVWLGSLEIFKHLYKYLNPTSVVRWISIKGNLDMLKYAHENHCLFDQMDSYLAAQCGNLNCLQYLHDNKCQWDAATCYEASRNGHLDCLQYAYEHQCPWNIYVCLYAAKNGHLNCLQYAHEQKCPWNLYVCKYAARNGHLDCLKYAHEQGCPWNADIYEYALKSMDKEVIQYVKNNMC